jgi:GDP-4-dehydro-6-deoxy-D-mannose reductase
MPPQAGTGQAVDLRDARAVRDVVRAVAPDVVYHLAALSSVGRSWEDPATTLDQNVATAVNMLEALRHEAPRARIVWVSSCEVYGASPQLPVEETAPTMPANPYAVSKTAGEQLAAVYADAYDLEIMCARPFNHTGPRQRPIFLVSSLTHQAAEGRVSRATRIRLATGNPDTRRDFTDVRDVVRAYRLLAERARPGIYNVSTGRSVSTGELVAMLAELIAPIEVEHEVDPSRLRSHEVMDLRGSNQRLRDETGWRPEISFRQTVSDSLAFWERELASAAAPGRAHMRH